MEDKIAVLKYNKGILQTKVRDNVVNNNFIENIYAKEDGTMFIIDQKECYISFKNIS